MRYFCNFSSIGEIICWLWGAPSRGPHEFDQLVVFLMWCRRCFGQHFNEHLVQSLSLLDLVKCGKHPSLLARELCQAVGLAL